MSPLAVLNALIFGSAAAIGFGLTATAVVFAILKSEEPELARELPRLVASCAWFWLLATASGASLYATLRRLSWRFWAQAGMWVALGLVVLVYWPAGPS